MLGNDYPLTTGADVLGVIRINRSKVNRLIIVLVSLSIEWGNSGNLWTSGQKEDIYLGIQNSFCEMEGRM